MPPQEKYKSVKLYLKVFLGHNIFGGGVAPSSFCCRHAIASLLRLYDTTMQWRRCARLKSDTIWCRERGYDHW